MTVEKIVARLKTLARPKSAAGMTRVGIAADRAWGVAIPDLRALAREIGQDHELAAALWILGFRETMILAGMIDDPRALTSGQMEAWAADFYDWEVCDQSCMNLFEKHPLAWVKAGEWSGREPEFVKRAGFVLMARLAVSDKKALDAGFEAFFPLIEREADDDRNMVKKGVNWALRQIGKRNRRLNGLALEVCGHLLERQSRAARWVAGGARRELAAPATRARLKD